MIFAGLFAHDIPYDAYRAFHYLEKQVQFGPRIPGTKDHLNCRDWIVEHAKTFADTVITQHFKAYRPVIKDSVDAFNIIVRFNIEKKERIILSTHWDTRPFADLDPLYPDQPVPGANDGASGTAVLLEMINQIDQFPNDPAVDIIFWDAEDMGIAGSGAYFCQGSEYYSENLFEPVPKKGILIDMIGDYDLQVPIEINSMEYAPDLVLEIWNIAHDLAYQHVFPKRTGHEIHDDHIPLNQIADIPTIVLIDFNYTHRGRNLWHTTHDLPSYCSPRSLQIIADILITWLLRQ